MGVVQAGTNRSRGNSEELGDLGGGLAVVEDQIEDRDIERLRPDERQASGDVVRDARVLASYLNASEQVLSRSGDRMSSIASALGANQPSERPEPDEPKDRP